MTDRVTAHAARGPRPLLLVLFLLLGLSASLEAGGRCDACPEPKPPTPTATPTPLPVQQATAVGDAREQEEREAEEALLAARDGLDRARARGRLLRERRRQVADLLGFLEDELARRSAPDWEPRLAVRAPEAVRALHGGDEETLRAAARDVAAARDRAAATRDEARRRRDAVDGRLDTALGYVAYTIPAGPDGPDVEVARSAAEARVAELEAEEQAASEQAADADPARAGPGRVRLQAATAALDLARRELAELALYGERLDLEREATAAELEHEDLATTARLLEAAAGTAAAVREAREALPPLRRALGDVERALHEAVTSVDGGKDKAKAAEETLLEAQRELRRARLKLRRVMAEGHKGFLELVTGVLKWAWARAGEVLKAVYLGAR